MTSHGLVVLPVMGIAALNRLRVEACPLARSPEITAQSTSTAAMITQLLCGGGDTYLGSRYKHRKRARGLVQHRTIFGLWIPRVALRVSMTRFDCSTIRP